MCATSTLSNYQHYAIQDAAEDIAAAEAAAHGDVDMPDADGGDTTQLQEKRAELQHRQETQQHVLVAAAQGFAELLGGDAATVLLDLDAVQRVEPAAQEGQGGEEAQTDEGWSTEELQAHAAETWHNMTLARAQGLFRRYHVAVAPIAQEIKVCGWWGV